jgi:hypothetical protein
MPPKGDFCQPLARTFILGWCGAARCISGRNARLPAHSSARLCACRCLQMPGADPARLGAISPALVRLLWPAIPAIEACKRVPVQQALSLLQMPKQQLVAMLQQAIDQATRRIRQGGAKRPTLWPASRPASGPP